MNWEVFLIIQGYFLLGAFLFIKARSKQSPAKKSSWSKYFTYMMVVNMIAYSITENPMLFKVLSLFIVLQGAYEVIRAIRYKTVRFKAITLTVYALLASGFLWFSHFPSGIIVWAYMGIFIFDGFSQIGGQLFGRTKLAPTISPNKTVEGTLCGTLVTLVSVYLMSHISGLSTWASISLGFLICLTALFGDLLASYLKRKCGIKDYGKLLPGHGGILDRFDSFVFTGAVLWMVIGLT